MVHGLTIDSISKGLYIMTLSEIKSAISQGHIVCWKHDGYRVVYSSYTNMYYVVFKANNSCTGLTHNDGVTTDYDLEEFYIWEDLGL